MNKNKKFLIVDDSEVTRTTIKNFFRGSNIDLVYAINGLDGIQKTAEHKPDLIILDIHMPDFDGLKMLKVIKLLDDMKDIPVIVMSGNTDRNNVLAVIKAGAVNVIAKPLQMSILFRAVNEVFNTTILRNPRETEFYSELEKLEMRKEMLKIFMSTFSEQEQAILTSLSAKKNETLYFAIHNIKGAGTSIGYPKITELAAEIEMKLQFSELDWSFISLKCEQLLNYINSINREK